MAKTLSQNCRSCVDDALEEVAGQQDDDDIEIIDAEEEPGLDYIRHDPSVQRDLSLDEFLNEHIEKTPELPDSIDAEPPDVIPPPTIRHLSYKLNFFPSHIYEDFLRTGELPPCPDGVGQRGDRGAPAGAKNIDGEPARNFRHDITWYKKIRIIHRYQELQRMIASNKFVPEKPPIQNAQSHFIMAYLDFWAERMPVAVVPSGMTSFLQWIDVHFAKDYRLKHTSRYEKFEGIRKTASQKRRLMTVVIGQSAASLATHERIIRTFVLIGYLDATVMPKTVKNLEVPPEQTATQITETGRIINEYMETSRVAKKNRAEKAAALPATQPLLTPNPTAPAASKRGKKPVPPISGQRSLTNWMTLKITSASQPIEPNHVPLSVPVTPSPTPVPGTQQSSEVYDPCEISIVFKELGCSAKEIEEVVQASVVSQMSLAVIGSRTPEGPSQSDSEMKWMIASAMADDDSSSGFEMPQAFKDCGYRYSEPEEGEDARNCVWSQPLYTTQGTMIVNKKKRSCKI
eukprot:GILJ01012219.1.p1 GENE.GILJ01012219.1~~GILJ01012219.1.p1  ORF type:complete len:515 (+),score=47.46 GILJ01012219.1:399-1943(+)